MCRLHRRLPRVLRLQARVHVRDGDQPCASRHEQGRHDTLVRLTFRAAITSGQVVSQGYQRRQVPRGARHVSLLPAFPFPLQRSSVLTTSVVPLPQHERQNHLQETRHRRSTDLPPTREGRDDRPDGVTDVRRHVQDRPGQLVRPPYASPSRDPPAGVVGRFAASVECVGGDELLSVWGCVLGEFFPISQVLFWRRDISDFAANLFSQPKWWTTESAARETVCHRCWLNPTLLDPPPAKVDS